MRPFLARLVVVSVSLVCAGVYVGCVGDEPGTSSDGTDSGVDAGGGDATSPTDSGGSDASSGLPAPVGVSFVDVDPTVASVEGIVIVQHATNESDLDSYVLYLGSSPTKKLFNTPIGTIPVSGHDVTFHYAAAIPAGATNILAFSHGGGVESTASATTVLHDGVPTYADISADSGVGSATQIAAAYDETNAKILIATDDMSNGNKPALFRCAIDGTGCVVTDISSDAGTGQANTAPSIAIDQVHGKVYVVTTDASNMGMPSAFICNLDATGCTHTNIAAAYLHLHVAFSQSVAIDSVNNKLLVVTENEFTGNTLAIFVCDLDGTNCNFRDGTAGAGNSSGRSPSPVIDKLNSKLLIVSEDESFRDAGTAVDKPLLTTCALDGSGCVGTDISAGAPNQSGFNPSAVIDSASNKLLVVTTDNTGSQGKIRLFRCNLDGSACTTSDISAGQPVGSGYYPRAILDAANGKLLVVAHNTGSQAPGVFRCALNGTACTYFDMSAGGQSTTAGLYPAITLEPTTGRFGIETSNGNNSNKPALFFLK
jgi:hypothetical protein